MLNFSLKDLIIFRDSALRINIFFNFIFFFCFWRNVCLFNNVSLFFKISMGIFSLAKTIALDSTWLMEMELTALTQSTLVWWIHFTKIVGSTTYRDSIKPLRMWIALSHHRRWPRQKAISACVGASMLRSNYVGMRCMIGAMVHSHHRFESLMKPKTSVLAERTWPQQIGQRTRV